MIKTLAQVGEVPTFSFNCRGIWKAVYVNKFPGNNNNGFRVIKGGK